MTLRRSSTMRGVLVAFGLLVAPEASATWSLVAVDPDTGEVGAVGATCGPMVWMIARVEPGVGAAVSLCATRMSARADLTEALADGETPEDALRPLLVPAQDDDLGLRQYAVAGFAGPGAGFTGDACDGWKGHLTGETWAAAGNTLADELVLTEAVATFEDLAGEPLAERLLSALEAGAARGGDQRCDPDVAARSAFLKVAAEGDGHRPGLDLTGASRDGAIPELRARFDAGKDRTFHLQCAAAPGPSSPALAALALLFVAARRRTRRGGRHSG